MLVPVSWLREYVRFDSDSRKLAHDLTMSGTKIEKVHETAADFEGVFVGKVLEAGRHPGADKLSLCRVESGGEELRIVCGAPNVRAGQTVAVAKIGARLAGGLKIRKSKIRGEVSEGMICSSRELGLGQESDGILVLDSSLASGRDFREVAGGGDAVLEAEITPNRPDCLCIYGIAREVGALYGADLVPPRLWEGGAGLRPAPILVEIENPADCARYLGRTLRNVKIGDSPAWLQARLRSVGLTPINNVVDVTNFVLFETGQPLHTFDLEKLRGSRLAVRRARSGERMYTLDGVERALDPDVLVIADAEVPVALAGIMGGGECAVRAETHHLLLEAAWFDPQVVRTGRRKLGLDTDASYRFERGADVEAVRWAADRATHLLQEVAGAEVVEADADACPRPYRPRSVRLRVERANRLVGVRLDAAAVAGLLRRLQLQAEPKGEAVEVSVPSFRRDLAAEIDLVEEVARVYGYENIEGEVLPPAPLVYREDRHDAFVTRARDFMVGLGYFEVRTSAFMERDDPARLALPEDDGRRKAVRVRNPIVASLGTMRTSLLPGVLRVLRHNRNHDQEQLRFVQLDRVFIDVPGPHAGLPSEPEHLVALVCGLAEPASWSQPARDTDLYDAKGDLESLLGHLGVDSVCTYGYTEPFLDADTSFLVSGTYGAIGRCGAVRADVLRAFDVEGPVFAFDLDLDALEKHLPGRRAYRELPRFPAAKRDLSLVVPAHVTYQQIHGAVTAAGGADLESVHCFDVYQGGALGRGERSLGIRLRFRAAKQTLSDAAVDQQIQAIVRRLVESLDVKLRTG